MSRRWYSTTGPSRILPVHDNAKAVEDLQTVLTTSGVSKEITAAARERQERLRRRQDHTAAEA